MKGEYISIETLRIWHEQEKENIELQEKIDRAIEYIDEEIKSNYFKRYEDEVYKMCDDLLKILKGESNE